MALEESNFAERFRKHLLPQQRRQVLLALRDKLDLETSLGDIVEAAQRIGWGDALGELRLDELASAMYGEAEEQADAAAPGFSADLADELARVLDARVARRRAKLDNTVQTDSESQARQAQLKAALEEELDAVQAGSGDAQVQDESEAAEDDYDEDGYDEDGYYEDDGYNEEEAEEPVQEELELEDELTAALAAASKPRRGASKRGAKKKASKKKASKKKASKKKAGKKKAAKKKAAKKKAGRVGRPPKKSGKKKAGKKKSTRSVGRPAKTSGKKKAGKKKAGKKKSGKKKSGRRR